jgi:hypothetical protein
VADAKFSWNIFFRGPEGYKEHVQAQFEDGTELGTARTNVLTVLKEIGAKPEEERKQYPQQRTAPDQGAQNLAAQAAAQGAVQKACPVHGSPMQYKAGGFSRTKTDAAGNPKPYSASLRCPEQGCNQVEWLGR